MSGSARVIVPYTFTKPAPPRTGLGNPKCYASSLNDCDGVISREHYISEGLLLEIGPLLRVTAEKLGFDDKPLPPASLTAKILCARHNTALSGLDAKACDYFRCLKNAENRLESGGGEDYFNGYDFERWLLKVLCGFIRVDGGEVPELWARILFCDGDIVEPSGLNMNVRVGDNIERPQSVIFETGRNTHGELVGCSVTMLGFRYLLSLHGRRMFGLEDLGKESVWRPAHIRWTHALTSASYLLGFSWYPNSGGDGFEVKWTPAPELE